MPRFEDADVSGDRIGDLRAVLKGPGGTIPRSSADLDHEISETCFLRELGGPLEVDSLMI